MTTSLFLTISEPTDLLKHQITSIIQQSCSIEEMFIIDSSGDPTNADRIEQMQTQAAFVIEPLYVASSMPYAQQLNTAIHRSKGDFLIVVHGNGFFHPKFVQHHQQFSKRGLFLHGVVSKTAQSQPSAFSENFQQAYRRVKTSGDAFYFPFRSYFSRPKSFFTKENEIQNMSFWREDFNLINGYDEDYETRQFAQYDFTSRLTHLGVKSKPLQGAAFFYQPNVLATPLIAAEDSQRHEKTLIKKRIVAVNGVEKI